MSILDAIQRRERYVPTDFHPVLLEALRLADHGALDQKLRLPDGSMKRVRKIITEYGLQNIVSAV